MKNTKKLLIFLTLVVLMLVVAGCGPTKDTTTQGSTKETANTKTAQVSQTLVEQWKESRHAKSFRPEYFIPVKDGGYLGNTCFLQCHSGKVITENITVTADTYKKFMDGGEYAGQLEGVSCRICHKLDSTGISLNKTGWDTCTSCHFAEHKKDGQLLTHPQKEMFFGYEFGELKIQPTVHSTVLSSCTDCHTTNSTKHDMLPPKDYKVMFDQPKCKSCHTDPQAMAEKLKKDQEVINERLTKYKPIWVKSFLVYRNFTVPSYPGSKMANKPANMDAFIKDFGSVVSKWSTVYYDYSKGAHNPKAAKEFLDFTEPKLEEIQVKYKDLLEDEKNIYGKWNY